MLDPLALPVSVLGGTIVVYGGPLRNAFEHHVTVFVFPPPCGSLVLEVPNELFFLRIHAQDGIAGVLKPFPEFGNQFELTVSIWILSFGNALAVDPKRVPLLLEQLAYGIGTKTYTPCAHFLADRSCVFPAPLLIAHRIAGRVRFHQFIQEGDHVVFF